MSKGRVLGDALDRYDTPGIITQQFLDQWKPRTRIRRILEPCAGSGAMLRELRGHWSLAQIDATDIDPRTRMAKRADILDPASMADALGRDAIGSYDLIITNPPFILAQEMLDRSLELVRRGGLVVLLLRLGFLESSRRNVWWRTRMPREVWVLPSRPRFYKSAKGSTSDSATYGWFVWKNDASLRERSFAGHILDV